MEYAIEIQGICKNYQDFRLDNVTFRVPSGSIVGLVGENGAGKSTTIKAILDLIQLDGGTVSVLGQDSRRMERERKARLGVVLDNCSFHDNLTYKDINKIMKEMYKKDWKEALFEEYRQRFKLPLDKKVKEYSRGMKQKLGIAVALSHDAKLLILDEATSGLDPVIRDEILDILLEFIQDESHSVLISSHIISDLEKVADYITFLHQGKVVFSENKDDLIYNYGVVKCSEEDYRAMDKDHVVAARRNQFACEVLIDNKSDFERMNRNMVVDSTTIEEIILFNVRGERA